MYVAMGHSSQSICRPVSSENLPRPQSLHEIEVVSSAYLPEMQFVQANVVAQFECVPVLHGAHDVGHEIELMSAGVATRLGGGEEPSAPAGHPFVTIAEAVQERVPVELNVLSGQVSSSLAAPSR